MRKTRQKIIKALTAVAGLGFVVSACCLDANSKVPMYICVGCVAWLALIYAANHDSLT